MPVFAEILQVNFQTRQEHDIEQPYCAEKHDTGVALQQVKPIGPDENAGNDQAHQPRHTRAREQRGGQ